MFLHVPVAAGAVRSRGRQRPPDLGVHFLALPLSGHPVAQPLRHHSRSAIISIKKKQTKKIDFHVSFLISTESGLRVLLGVAKIFPEAIRCAIFFSIRSWRIDSLIRFLVERISGFFLWKCLDRFWSAAGLPVEPRAHLKKSKRNKKNKEKWELIGRRRCSLMMEQNIRARRRRAIWRWSPRRCRRWPTSPVSRCVYRVFFFSFTEFFFF